MKSWHWSSVLEEDPGALCAQVPKELGVSHQILAELALWGGSHDHDVIGWHHALAPPGIFVAGVVEAQHGQTSVPFCFF